MRRLHSALSIFKPALCDDPSEKMGAELRRLAATPGEARDMDVLLARLQGGELEQVRAAREQAYADVLSRLGIAVANDAPSAKKRESLLAMAAEALAEFADTRPFWR